MSCLRNAKVMKILVYVFFFLRIFIRVYLSQTDNICLGARSPVLPSMFSFRFLFLTFHIQNWFISARNSVAFSIPWQWVPLLVQSLKSQPPAHTWNQQMYQGESSCRGQISHLCESLSLSGILVPPVLIVSVPSAAFKKMISVFYLAFLNVLYRSTGLLLTIPSLLEVEIIPLVF